MLKSTVSSFFARAAKEREETEELSWGSPSFSLSSSLFPLLLYLDAELRPLLAWTCFVDFRPQDPIDNGAGRQRFDKEEGGEEEDGDDFVPQSRKGASSNDFRIEEGGKI